MLDPKFSIEPSARPYKWRCAARIIVRAGHLVLLIEDSDPGVPDFWWLVTPGGGVDAGETWAEAARREMKEETGLEIDPARLQGPVASRVVVHSYSDQILVQDERFFCYEVDEPFEPSSEGFTEDEKLTFGTFRWIDPAAGTDERIWPDNLADLVAAAPDSCQELGVVHESSVELSGAQQARVQQIIARHRQ